MLKIRGAIKYPGSINEINMKHIWKSKIKSQIGIIVKAKTSYSKITVLNTIIVLKL